MVLGMGKAHSKLCLLILYFFFPFQVEINFYDEVLKLEKEENFDLLDFYNNKKSLKLIDDKITMKNFMIGNFRKAALINICKHGIKLDRKTFVKVLEYLN